MDSIGSAIGAAELMGGHASRASDINSETQFALKVILPCFAARSASVLQNFDADLPPPFLTVKAEHKVQSFRVSDPSQSVQNAGVCLVDHNQASQMTAGAQS